MDRAPCDRAPLPPAAVAAPPPHYGAHPHSNSRSPSSTSPAARHPPPLNMRPRSPPRDPRTRDPRIRPPSSDRDHQPIHHHHLLHAQQQNHHHHHHHHHDQYRNHYERKPSPVHSPHAAPPPPRKPRDSVPNTTDPRYRKDPVYRKKVMRTEALPLHDFKLLRARKIKGDKTEGGMVPIPMPLEPGETEREYEEALHAWLRGKGVFLKDLHDDPLRERIFRNSYANMRVTPAYKPQVKLDARSSKDYEAGGRDESRDEGGNGSVRKRSGSLEDHDRLPHKVHVMSHPHSNSSNSISSSRTGSSSRDYHYDDDSSCPRHSQRPVSPSQSPHESSSKRCEAQLPAPNASLRSFVAAYAKCYCFHCLRDWNLKLTERLEVLENEVHALRKRVAKDDKLVDANASSKDRLPKKAKAGSKDPRMKTKINGENEEKTTSETGKVKSSTAPKFSSTPTTTSPSSEGKLRTQRSATNQGPESTTASSSTSSAVRPVEDLSSQASESSTRRAISNTSTASETSSNAAQRTGENEMDITSESKMASANPDEPPAESVTESQGFLGNAETSQDSPDQTEPVHAQELLEASISAADSTADALAIEQSVKAQMTEEYDSLNKQILINERVLQDAVEHIQQKMVTDMAGALREQEQIHQLRQSIVEEMGNRDAALAMVIAYCWMGKHEELMDCITQLDTLDVPHVQRVGHVKCAELATRIAEKNLQLATLKAQVAVESLSNGDTANSQVVIDDLKSQIALAEAALAALEEERMEQFMRLFQFSNRIRALCRSMLEEKG